MMMPVTAITGYMVSTAMKFIFSPALNLPSSGSFTFLLKHGERGQRSHFTSSSAKQHALANVVQVHAIVAHVEQQHQRRQPDEARARDPVRREKTLRSGIVGSGL